METEKRYDGSRTKKKRKKIVNRRRFALSIIVLIGIIASTYALFTDSFTNTFSPMLGTFDIEAQIKVNGVVVEDVSEISPGTWQLKILPYVYEDVTLDITYIGNAKANVRFKIIEEWVKEENSEETIVPVPMAKMTLDSRVVDNRSVDGYYYFSDPLQNATKDATRTYNAITKVTAPNIPADEIFPTALKLTIYVDAAQSNRAKKIWGIEQIPQ